MVRAEVDADGGDVGEEAFADPAADLDDAEAEGVELETCSRSKPLKLLATVMYCQPTSEGEYRHGCQFVKPLSQQQLRDLLQ